MHTEIKYDIETEEGKKKALKDIKDWLGTKKYNKVIKDFKDTPVTQDQFSFLLGIAGIQGYPATVMYEEIYGVEWEYTNADR